MAKGMRGAFVLMALLTLVMTALGSLLLGYEFGQTALEGVSPPERG
ncbi:MAG: hypothetical protein HC926_02295 [Synechococcaceae cyanobacterium SM2_3_60]|nr:hypothetical protein [Synechococcaceae cyanobacterium SM2_3_60]